MVELVRWLGAQFDEDERIALGADPGPWKSDSLGRHDQAAIKLGASTSTSLIQFDGSHAAANGAHVARHDPARVLREIDAKRQIAEQHRPVGYGNVCLSYCHTRTPSEPQTWPCLTLRLLALPYAGRPGYREEWRP